MSGLRRIRPPICSRGLTFTCVQRTVSSRLGEKKRIFDDHSKSPKNRPRILTGILAQLLQKIYNQVPNFQIYFNLNKFDQKSHISSKKIDISCQNNGQKLLFGQTFGWKFPKYLTKHFQRFLEDKHIEVSAKPFLQYAVCACAHFLFFCLKIFLLITIIFFGKYFVQYVCAYVQIFLYVGNSCREFRLIENSSYRQFGRKIPSNRQLQILDEKFRLIGNYKCWTKNSV